MTLHLERKKIFTNKENTKCFFMLGDLMTQTKVLMPKINCCMFDSPWACCSKLLLSEVCYAQSCRPDSTRVLQYLSLFSLSLHIFWRIWHLWKFQDRPSMGGIVRHIIYLLFTALSVVKEEFELLAVRRNLDKQPQHTHTPPQTGPRIRPDEEMMSKRNK